MAARHKSALKAHRQNVIRRARNRDMRSKLRTALKAMRSSMASGDAAAASGSLNATVSLIDKMATKGIIHANTASRYKSRMTRRLSQLATA